MPDDRKYTLKELRARKDVTQEQAARDLGVSTQTYNDWEKNGIAKVAINKVMKLAEYFGVQMGDIFLPINMNDIQVEEED